MVFITAGMGGGTGTGAAPVVARAAREMGILTVGVVTKPFQFEGARRMRVAEAGIIELQQSVDTLIVIPNQNLFRVANEKTTFASAFAMADQVLYSGVACITDLMVKEGLINLDFADVRAIMRGMGKAMMGTGEASGENRAMRAAEAAIANPLIDDVSMKGARGLLISITGGPDLTLYEVDEAATRIREEVDTEANIILGATFDEGLEGIIRVSVVATGIDQGLIQQVHSDLSATEQRIAEVAERLRAEARTRGTSPQTVPNLRSESVIRPTAEVPAPVAQVAPPPAPVVEAAPYIEPAPQAPIRDEVTFTPAAPKQAMAYEAPMEHAPVEAHIPAQPYIPPQPERAGVMRPARMPRVEELPLPGQAQLRATRAVEPELPAGDPKRLSLLQRLATVGFGRKEDGGHHPAPEPAPRSEAPRAPAAPGVSPAHAQYAKRPAAPQGYAPAQGQLDQQGRVAPQRASEDDQLEIPAFLRRQSS
jgi:cell division protein FtsZ